MRKINLFIPMLTLAGLFLLFIFTTSSLDATKAASQWNLNLYAGIGLFLGFAILNKKSSFDDYFSISSYREALNRFAVGLVWGVIGVFALNYFLQGSLLLHDLILTNLFGSVPQTFLAQITSEGAWFTILVQPFTETLLIGVMVLMIYSFLASKKVRGAILIAVVLCGLAFSGFHFVSQGHRAYEMSFAGYANYIGDIRGYGKGGYSPAHYGGSCPVGTTFSSEAGVCKYTGGLPLLFLGLLWGVLFVAYKNFLVPAGAHAFNNWLVLFLAPQLALGVSQFVDLVGVLFVLIVVFSVWKNGLKGLFAFNTGAFA